MLLETPVTRPFSDNALGTESDVSITVTIWGVSQKNQKKISRLKSELSSKFGKPVNFFFQPMVEDYGYKIAGVVGLGLTDQDASIMLHRLGSEISKSFCSLKTHLARMEAVRRQYPVIPKWTSPEEKQKMIAKFTAYLEKMKKKSNKHESGAS